MEGWIVNAVNKNNTWHRGNSKKKDLPDFSSIDPDSKYSAAIFYDKNNYQNEQLVSPYIKLDNKTICKFYSAFDGVFVLWANFTIHVEKKSDSISKEVFNAFLWSQGAEHERHKWLQFEIDLSEFTGEEIRFIFKYEGMDGDDVYIDDFCLYELDTTEQAKVFIREGQDVHFQDNSLGEPELYEWTFEGGNPGTSTEKNPVVNYIKSGIYDVKLKVTKDGESDEITKTAFVNVQGEAPVVDFDYPEAEGYLSPDAAIFIPLHTPVTFTDKSANIPTEWMWNFPGSDIVSSTEQNPVVSYSSPGIYDVSLTVKNNQGTDHITFPQSIQAGDTCRIWNITMEESREIGEINMGFFGYYAGSNWLGMDAFAEKYKKPVAEAEILSVDIYFAKTYTIDPPVDITVSIATDNNGLPGNILASKVILSDKLMTDTSTWMPTSFVFDNPVEIDTDFYIIVEGIPNRMDEDTYETDDIAIGAIQRPVDAMRETTSYHLLEEWDENYEPTGKYEWFKNEDENVSLAIAPRITFINTPPPSKLCTIEDNKPLLLLNDKKLSFTGLEEACELIIYNMQGVSVFRYAKFENSINLPLNSGMYIIQLKQGVKHYSYKIVL